MIWPKQAGALDGLNNLFKEFVVWLKSEDGSQFFNTIGMGISFVVLLFTSLIEVAQMVLPGINEVFLGIGWVIESVISVISFFANLIFSSMPAIVAAVTVAAGVFTLLYGQAMLSAAATVVHTTVTKAAAVATTIWSTAIAVLRTGITLLHVALAANPIGFVITLVLAAVAAFAVWSSNPKGKTNLLKVFGFIVETVESAINMVISAINGLIGGFNKVGGFVGKILGFDYHEIETIEYKADFSNFKSAGQDLIENFSLDDLKNKLKPEIEAEIPGVNGYVSHARHRQCG